MEPIQEIYMCNLTKALDIAKGDYKLRQEVVFFRICHGSTHDFGPSH